MVDTISIPSPADFHVHLRQGTMSSLVTPHVRKGGFRLAYVMPNLKPPITSTEQALVYKSELEKIDPSVTYLMTLYLSPELTPNEIRKAKSAGVSYPRGITTNSDGGIESYEMYYPVFEAMQEVDMVLNLHGEVPSDAAANVHILNAEPTFLPHLRSLHSAFPRLRIVLEHATTRAAVEAVKACGDTVACTITPHHLALTVDDWAGQALNYCKPVAKYPDDRQALRDVIREVAELLESFDALDKMTGFVSHFGKAFYGINQSVQDGELTVLRKVPVERLQDSKVPDKYVLPNGEEAVIPFWAGRALGWEVVSP
ncbi:hypothetical protein ONZ45_g530 [Pleurotus djamor]|nr:hypothetical protein ONZ45_g530 [Pleurotus djamor]